MSDEITPQAKPIPQSGSVWFPPAEDDAEASILQRQPKNLHWVFFGSAGLRAGWSLLLWFLFSAALSIILNGAMHRLLSRSATRRGQQGPEWIILSSSAIGFLVTGTAGWLVSRIERRPWSAYGINTRRGWAGQFGVGLLSGFVMLSVLIATLWKGGFLVFRGVLLPNAGQVVLWSVIFGLSFLFTGIFEEFTFRGFPQFTLTRGLAGLLRLLGMEEHAPAIAFWITAVLLAVAFGAVHGSNPGEGKLGLVSAGLIGFLFAFSLWRTGSLWWAIGFHAAWDWGESFFYGTADSGGVSKHRLLDTAPQGNPFYSGGTVGPEGSVFVLAVIVLTALLIAFTLKPRPDSPALGRF